MVPLTLIKPEEKKSEISPYRNFKTPYDKKLYIDGRINEPHKHKVKYL
jgi:hypothetical protein